MPRELRWQLLRWFFDYLEANAGEYWEVPAATWPEGGIVPVEEPFADDDDEEEEDDDPFAAAYEGVVYRDSTRDGVEGELFDPTSQATEYELDQESARLHRRIGFLATLMELWRIAGVLLCETVPPPKAAARKSKKAEAASCAEQPEAEINCALLDAAQSWLARCVYLRQELQEFAQQIHRHPVPQPSTSHESMVEYDRRQYVKEMLLDHAIRTVVSAGAAIRSLLTMEHCAIPAEG
jgi:pyruvate/2-oxoglutarate dehydrogenase complex dihydrolipoamide acyltransferase (E2) component